MVSNTATELIVDSPWAVIPDTTSRYEIVNEADEIVALNGEQGDDIINASPSSFDDGGLPRGVPLPGDDLPDSTLPLVLFGGEGADTIIAGTRADLVFGDRGRVDYLDDEGALMTRLGFGPDANVTEYPTADTDVPADQTDGRYLDPRFIVTFDTLSTGKVSAATSNTLEDADAFFRTDGNGLTALRVRITDGTGAGQARTIVANTVTTLTVDRSWAIDPDASSRYVVDTGNDVIRGAGDEDILLGGPADDAIDGGPDSDLIFGDGVRLDRRLSFGDGTDPRFRGLLGSEIYDANGDPRVDVVTRHEDPTRVPGWADWRITLLDENTGLDTFGDDYLAGGPSADRIFGQLGNDTIQGDGSVDGRLAGDPVLARREADGTLTLVASFETTADGDDYIEGNGGDDVIFGNLGQDDILGGSSALFSLATPAQRTDGADILFGGAGTHAGRNDFGDDSPERHARDADVILGDNGNIFRLVSDTSGSVCEPSSFSITRRADRLSIRRRPSLTWVAPTRSTASPGTMSSTACPVATFCSATGRTMI